MSMLRLVLWREICQEDVLVITWPVQLSALTQPISAAKRSMMYTILCIPFTILRSPIRLYGNASSSNRGVAYTALVNRTVTACTHCNTQAYASQTGIFRQSISLSRSYAIPAINKSIAARAEAAAESDATQSYILGSAQTITLAQTGSAIGAITFASDTDAKSYRIAAK
jgi:hypothetical protein